MDLLKTSLPLIFPAILVAAALRDLTSFTIPNWMSGVLFLLYFPIAWIVGLSLGDIGLAAALGVTGLLVGFGMFAANWIGGGDAKLLAASAPWIGLSGLPTFLLVTAISGGGLAMMLLWLRSDWVAAHVATGPKWLTRLATPGEGVPYGVAIAFGGLIAFPVTKIAGALVATF